MSDVHYAYGQHCALEKLGMKMKFPKKQPKFPKPDALEDHIMGKGMLQNMDEYKAELELEKKFESMVDSKVRALDNPKGKWDPFN